MSAPPSSALADAVDRHAAELAPLVDARLGEDPRAEVHERLVWALGTMRDSLPEAPPGLPDLGAAVDRHAVRVARATAAAAALGGDPRLAMLHRALVEDVELSARALADQLAMHHGRRRVDRIVASLGQTDSDGHALAVELLEVLVGRELGERLGVLLTPGSLGEQAASAVEGAGDLHRSAAEWVGDLVSDPESRWHDPWLRACAVHAAPAVLAPEGALPLVGARVDDDDPVVAETAHWALTSLHRA
jgi:hypothetical protein